jgi:hypothetical protein
MMIGYINKYLKNLDYKYIKCIKKIKDISHVIFSIHHYIFNFFNMPFFIFKLNKNIAIFFYRFYEFFIFKYKKIRYTIFDYPKYYKNFKFYKHIKDIIKNDVHIIFDYYFNLFNIYS